MPQMEIEPKEGEKTTQGKPVFPGTGPISLFSSFLIYLFFLHIETNGNFKVTQGSAVLTFIKFRCFI